MPRFSAPRPAHVMTGGSFAWPPLGDDQRELLALVRTLATERIAPRAAEIDETHEFPWDIVELYREQGLFGLFFEERHGGTGTGALLALAAIEEVSKVCATSGVILAVAGARLARAQARRLGGAAGALPPPARIGRVACRLRADGVGLGLGLGRHADDGRARRRRLRAERRQAVHHERRRRRVSTPSSRAPIRPRSTAASAPSSSSPTRRASRSRASSRSSGSQGRRPASSSSTTAACRRRT